MVDIVTLPLSDKKTLNTRLASIPILGQMKNVWGNETGKPMDDYSVYEWKNWKNENNNRTIFLGGDHSITMSTFPKIKADRLIVLDSHFDLYGSLETHHPFHGNWLKVLIEDKIIDPHRVTMLGMRAWEKTELTYAQEKGIEYILFDCPSSLKTHGESIYLSIDIDVLDPAYAPGTGYMEPGGWSSRELLNVVKMLRNDNLVAMDIVEIDPTRDFNDMTSKIATKIIKEFL